MYSQSVTMHRQSLATQPQYEFSDAHCHLNLLERVDEALEAALQAGVRIIITAGGSSKDNFECARIAEKDHVFAVVGIGPDFAATDSAYVVEVPGIIRSSRKVIGIGEIGLDAKVADKNPMGLQKELLQKQVEIAKDLDMPVVVHSRGASEETAQILIENGVRKAMFHFFEGDEKQAAELAKRGFLISIPPAMTGRRKRIIKEVSLNSIVAETDSPIVGKTPSDVIGVCEQIAKLKGVSLEEVATKTTENIRRLFYI